MKLGATTPRATPLGIAAAVTALLAASLAAAAPEVEPRPTLARGKLLVANERLVDPNFRETVVLLLEYDADGALGVVINRPTDVKLALLLPDVEELRERSETVFLGGPVGRDRMLLLVRTGGDAPEESQRIFDDVFVTASLDVLRRVIRDPGPRDRFRAFVGFAGWAPRQLDDEIARGDWSVVPGDARPVFDGNPNEVWRELNERARGQWVRAPDPRPATLGAFGALVAAADVPATSWLGARASAPAAGRRASRRAASRQRASGGAALPPAARNASRAATLAFTS
ncbi:MAG TPA: YqgE/AlgH family protein [Candidatus Binatia bacterium]